MIYCNAFGAINALGSDCKSISSALKEGQTGLKSNNSWLTNQQTTFLGQVQADLPLVPPDLSQHNSRNNQLILAALEQIRPQVDNLISQFGHNRIAVIMGTSTSGIYEGELAIAHYLTYGVLADGFDYQQQQFGDAGEFLAKYLGLTGPSYTISTACSSSARAIISGYRLLKAGLVDAAIVGGADSLCKMAINGFNSLEAISTKQCLPFAQDRDGINIGEAAGLMILSKEQSDLSILGFGESSDAWHMSAPHPEGIGAKNAMQKALAHAKLTPENIGYINLHGTATRLNDDAESKAVYQVFADQTPCSSTKHLTGHTLGAAGITEAIISALILQDNLPLPQQDFTHSPQDAALAPIQLVKGHLNLKQKTILSNSFAFGGNNACLILGNR
ncbi:beta-ketoacyl-[acyl-carrier-protein] synthase family protein [Neisseria sp. Ec49-e6-T10]|uniref:beta-ketoacyl-[acyl-carrier-protein] synthase family protein n=1 Tax=Neisseria sp. Ec49-e6-T10 TaxID=3140744 RepID=UPI003EC0E8D8